MEALATPYVSLSNQMGNTNQILTVNSGPDLDSAIGASMSFTSPTLNLYTKRAGIPYKSPFSITVYKCQDPYCYTCSYD
jgi:hypothetical protein